MNRERFLELLIAESLNCLISIEYIENRNMNEITTSVHSLVRDCVFHIERLGNIIVGIPAKVIKESMTWKRERMK